MDKTEKYFDDMYRGAKGRRFSGEPRPYIKLLPRLQRYKKGVSALDIGGGEGQNIIFLSKNGYKCTGTDISTEGLKRARAYAREEGVKARFLQLDIRKDGIKGAYDLLILTLVLHNLEEKERYAAIEKMIKATKPFGINFISFYVSRRGKNEFPGLEKRLLDMYRNAGFKRLKLARYNSKLQDGSGCRITTLIARKTG